MRVLSARFVPADIMLIRLKAFEGGREYDCDTYRAPHLIGPAESDNMKSLNIHIRKSSSVPIFNRTASQILQDALFVAVQAAFFARTLDVRGEGRSTNRSVFSGLKTLEF